MYENIITYDGNNLEYTIENLFFVIDNLIKKIVNADCISLEIWEDDYTVSVRVDVQNTRGIMEKQWLSTGKKFADYKDGFTMVPFTKWDGTKFIYDVEKLKKQAYCIKRFIKNQYKNIQVTSRFSFK